MKNKTTFLYRYFNGSGELLYIGISASVLTRLRGHKSQSDWFGSAVTIRFERFKNRTMALAAEAEAIRNENPIFNKSHAEKPKKTKQPKEEKYFPSFIMAEIKTYKPEEPEEPEETEEPEKKVNNSRFVDLWLVVDFDDVRKCLIAIGVIHAEFPLCFELKDENDIDSNIEDLTDDISCLYGLLVDSAIECGASWMDIGEAYTPDFFKQDLLAFAESTLLTQPTEQTCSQIDSSTC